MDIMDVFTKRNQRGASLIIIIAIILIMGIIAAVFVSLINTESFTALNQSAGEEAFAIAEGGLEFEQRSLAQNLDWYRSTSDPIAITTKTLGSGSFTVSSNLPATTLRTRIPACAPGITIRVYTADRFPIAGFLQIEDDITTGEFVQYTGKGSNTFTGISCNVTIGTVTGAPGAHERGDRVYPVTTLNGNITAAATTITIAAHLKFLSAGTIDIEGEEITYTGSTITGGNMTLQGVSRGQNGTVAAAHSNGQPVTPILVDGSSPDYEAEAVSTGTVSVAVAGNVNRVTKKTISR